MQEQASGNGLLHADGVNGARGGLATAHEGRHQQLWHRCLDLLTAMERSVAGPLSELNMTVVVSKWRVELGAVEVTTWGAMRSSPRCLGSRQLGSMGLRTRWPWHWGLCCHLASSVNQQARRH